jgi:hypothetical protein
MPRIRQVELRPEGRPADRAPPARRMRMRAAHAAVPARGGARVTPEPRLRAGTSGAPERSALVQDA